MNFVSDTPEHVGQRGSVRSSVALWPNQREVAELVRVSPATVSRAKLPGTGSGQERRVEPAGVLELAERYEKRDLSEVAAGLVELGRARCETRAQLADLERNISDYFARSTAVAGDGAWLREARRRLPSDVYEQVLHAHQAGGSMHGVRFDDEEEG